MLWLAPIVAALVGPLGSRSNDSDRVGTRSNLNYEAQSQGIRSITEEQVTLECVGRHSSILLEDLAVN
jgi:hypothetical protein